MFFTIIAAITFAVFGFSYEAHIHDLQVKKIEHVVEVKCQKFLDAVREEHYKENVKGFECDRIEFIHAFAELEFTCSELEEENE